MLMFMYLGLFLILSAVFTYFRVSSHKRRYDLARSADKIAAPRARHQRTR